jgi:hypothetical protein
MARAGFQFSIAALNHHKGHEGHQGTPMGFSFVSMVFIVVDQRVDQAK